MSWAPTLAEYLRRREREWYAENVGHEGVTRFPDDPDWLYQGTKAEREALAERVGLSEHDDEVPVVIDGQEAMFG